MDKYGKSSAFLLKDKQNLFTDNETLLDKNVRDAAFYADQPPRERCVTCCEKLEGESFEMLGVAYTFCKTCGHLNGRHRDTDDYHQYMYTEEGGEAYSKVYAVDSKKEYAARVANVYIPKAEFLFENLVADGREPATLRYADFGAGSGYFVAALNELGAQEAKGYDVSATQVEIARVQLGEGSVELIGKDEIVAIAEQCDADVVAFIGSIEHMQDQDRILAAVCANPNVRYVYLCVPTFSPSVIFEAAFPKIANRQLQGGHTHLFTDSSIDWICDHFGMSRVGSWWYGTDVVDLFRAVTVSLNEQKNAALSTIWKRDLVPLIDELQLVMDCSRLSSEIHTLLRKK